MLIEQMSVPYPSGSDCERDAPAQGRDAQKMPIGPTYCVRRRHKPGRVNGAWEVIIHRDARIAAYRHFSDSKHGGYEAAFHAAMAYRDEMLKRHPPAPRAVINQRLKVTNHTGYPGVFEVRRKGKLQGYAAETKIPDGAKVRTYYSVAEYGRRQAFELAIVERRRQLQRVKGGVVRVAARLRHSVPMPAPAPVTEQALAPRRKSDAPKRVPRPSYDPDREERIAQAILHRYGRRRPHQLGAPELRGIRRYHPRGRATPNGGWEVMLYYRKRRLATRIFMDRPHGGAAAAFEKACEVRDALVRRYLPLLQESGYTGVLPDTTDRAPGRLQRRCLGNGA